MTGRSSTGAGSSRCGRRRDAGSGTALVLGLIGVVVVLIAFVTALGSAVVARHRAESAADLAALAAADCGCDRAAAVAGANGGVLTACHHGGDGSYTVQVAVFLVLPASLLHGHGHGHGHGDGVFLARASARAVVLAGEVMACLVDLGHGEQPHRRGPRKAEEEPVAELRATTTTPRGAAGVARSRMEIYETGPRP